MQTGLIVVVLLSFCASISSLFIPYYVTDESYSRGGNGLDKRAAYYGSSNEKLRFGSRFNECKYVWCSHCPQCYQPSWDSKPIIHHNRRFHRPPLHQNKREFNAGDLTLRFGKRADVAGFQPENLSLRFGR